MEIIGDGIDEVLMQLYGSMGKQGAANVGHRGPMTETLGVLLRMQNPRARLSRSQDRGKFFSALGELLWYLEGSDKLEFIVPYIPDYADDAVDGRLHGAYGPRFYGIRGEINQLDNIINLLSEDPKSKRAVIQLFDAHDITRRFKEIPCTMTMQFLLRDNRLTMSVTMRSNDAYLGVPHDVFCFTMLQEMLARRLGCELGEYLHYVGSMHVYDKHTEDMKNYIGEGWQKTIEMPGMPVGNPFDAIPRLLEAERAIRAGQYVSAAAAFPDAYWADICRLLQVYWVSKNEMPDAVALIDGFIGEMTNDVYRGFLNRRHDWQVRREVKNQPGIEASNVAH